MGLYIVPSDGDRALFAYDELAFSAFGISPSSSTQYAMASSPDNPNTVFLAVSEASTTRLYISHDAGGTWNIPPRPIIFPSVVTESPALQLAAPSSSSIYCWNSDLFGTSPGIHRSTDGGGTWTQIVTLPGGFIGGWMAVSATKVFYSQQDAPYPVAANTRWGQMSIWRANLDGSARAQIATILFGPNVQGGGTVYQPRRLLLRALSDNSVLVCARYGTSVLSTPIVPPGDVTLSSTAPVGSAPALGSPVTITPDDRDGVCVVALRVHFDSATPTSGTKQYRFEFAYQNDDLTWSSRFVPANGVVAPATGHDWWCKDFPVPCGARAIQCYIARTSATNYTLNGLRVDLALDTGFLLRVDADGTVTDLRPPAMRRPWDVLPLTSTRWLAAGAESVDAETSQPITVMRTDDAGSSWSMMQTIPAEQGFNADNTFGVQDNSTLLCTRAPASTTQVAMSGAASSTVQQIIWTSDDAGATWTDLVNTADTSTDLNRSTFLITGPQGVRVAIPSRQASIVG